MVRSAWMTISKRYSVISMEGGLQIQARSLAGLSVILRRNADG
jgi:hypothetical protein